MNKKIVLILLAVGVAVLALIVLRGEEDTWLCDMESGTWVQHGAPSAPAPTEPCGYDAATDTNDTLMGGEASDAPSAVSGDVRGSCNAIAEASTCIEYYGSFWNTQQMQLQCEGSGTFSVGSCPTGMAGGCNTGVGTTADMVVWMYLTGGGEMTQESMQYAAMACDATMASQWISR